MASRTYTSRRYAIVTALANALKAIDGTGDYQTNINNQAFAELKFWDEITSFPAIFVIASDETRQYQGGRFKDRFLNVILHCYVNQAGALNALEGLIEDIETVVEDNGRLNYTNRDGATETTRDITLVSISTDEGVLEPYGVAQVTLKVDY